jgi:NAD(P)-dependent dehydrogenase (short-subunit alcohol dehydrogenase family)
LTVDEQRRPTVPSPLLDAEVVVVGGTSGIGLATALLAQSLGAEVTVVGRDRDRLADALTRLGGAAKGVAFDVADERAVQDLFASFEHVDHVAMLSGSRADGEIASIDTSSIAGPVNDRLWGALYVCKHAAPKMTDGSITICTGVGVARPRRGGAVVAAAAGASEVLARTAALELAPIRVNVVRPGLVDTPLLTRMAGDRRDAVIASQSKRIPLGRIAQPEEIADAIVFLMTNTYVTGTTLTVDGGVSLV